MKIEPVRAETFAIISLRGVSIKLNYFIVHHVNLQRTCYFLVQFQSTFHLTPKNHSFLEQLEKLSVGHRIENK